MEAVCFIWMVCHVTGSRRLAGNHVTGLALTLITYERAGGYNDIIMLPSGAVICPQSLRRSRAVLRVWFVNPNLKPHTINRMRLYLINGNKKRFIRVCFF